MYGDNYCQRYQEPIVSCFACPSFRTPEINPVSPPHYSRFSAVEPSCVGYAVKYLLRAGHKGDPIEDLEKAKRYIDFEIERLKDERTA